MRIEVPLLMDYWKNQIIDWNFPNKSPDRRTTYIALTCLRVRFDIKHCREIILF
ncbi:unnamed protein product [Commensalibacter communis]|nr:unnamed protein product [Commensalibacter communis]